MILCDTNILIEFYKNNPTIVTELKAIGTHNLAISVISQAELYYGALNKRELHQIKRHLHSLKILSIDSSVSNKFIELMEQYTLSHNLTIPDALIAATALVHDVKFYTLNQRDFRFIVELKLY